MCVCPSANNKAHQCFPWPRGDLAWEETVPRGPLQAQIQSDVGSGVDLAPAFRAPAPIISRDNPSLGKLLHLTLAFGHLLFLTILERPGRGTPLHVDYKVLKSERRCQAPPQASFPDCATAKDPPPTATPRVQSQATLRLFPPPKREDPINVES